MFSVRLAGDHLFVEKAVHLAVAGEVFDGVFLCCPFYFFFILFLKLKFLVLFFCLI